MWTAPLREGGGITIAGKGRSPYVPWTAANSAKRTDRRRRRVPELLARFATRRYVRSTERLRVSHEQPDTSKLRQQIPFRERESETSAPLHGDGSYGWQHRPRCVRCRTTGATRWCGDRDPHRRHHRDRHRKLRGFVLRHGRVCAVPGCCGRHHHDSARHLLGIGRPHGNVEYSASGTHRPDHRIRPHSEW